MLDERSQETKERPPPLKGGPLGLGDPDDKRLRKTESTIIIPKLILEEAEKKCLGPMKVFLDCAKDAGFSVMFKCKEQSNAKNDCVAGWMKNPDFSKEITDKYLEARSYYRRTGKPLNTYVRAKKLASGFC